MTREGVVAAAERRAFWASAGAGTVEVGGFGLTGRRLGAIASCRTVPSHGGRGEKRSV